MRPSVAFDLKQSVVREATSHFCAANPRVFGSVLHDTDQDGSDIDLLVDALPGTTLFDLSGLQEKLESLLGIHINLLTPADLPPKFRAKVLAEALPVLLKQLPAVQQDVEDEERNDDHSGDKSC